jgi:hypothetical protein
MNNYTVKLGQKARTILYEDSYGTIKFTFDVDVSSEEKTVYLDPKPKTIIQSEQTRIDLAYERTKEYLRSCGYQVKTTE